MNRVLNSRGAFVFLAALLLSGCVKMGPDFQTPPLEVNVPGTYHQSPAETATPWPDDPWWRVFNNPELDRVVQAALENNLDIRGATARILEVRSRFFQTRAERFPDLGLQGEAQRQRRTLETPAFGLGGLSIDSQRTTIDTYSLAFPATFELDLWGRLARAEESARAELLQAVENRRTIAQGVVSEAVSLYLVMESLERRIQITEGSIASFRRSLALVESRYKRGLTSSLDVRQARRILAQAEAVLPAFREELGNSQQRLAVLLGRYPDTRPARFQPEDYFRHLPPVPAGLPSELLLRRPDVRAAEARLLALNAQVGVAQASRFPRVTLTGSFGYLSDDLDLLFKPESEFWALAMGLFQPLFDAGGLKAAQRGAEARYAQGLAEYARAVLAAFFDVEAALLIRREQIERRERFVQFLHEARATQEVAESRYQRGLVDYLTVLDAQQTRFVAEQNLVEVDLAVLTNRVALHRALGGGWAELPPVRTEMTIQDYLPVDVGLEQ